MKNLRIIDRANSPELERIILEKIGSGCQVGIPTFFSVGYAYDAVNILIKQQANKLTIISNDSGLPRLGTGKLLEDGRVELLIASFVGTNSHAMKLYNEGRINVLIYPQGTLIEMINSAAKGLGGFFTPTGVGTDIIDDAGEINGQKVFNINGKDYFFYKPLKPEVALVKAHVADHYGNVIFNKSARNFNEATAMAADFTIVEADRIVDELDPNLAHVQSSFVDVVYQSSYAWKKDLAVAPKKLAGLSPARKLIVKKAAKLLKTLCPDGAIVNLGIGTPLEVANYLEAKDNILLMSENGILGMGPSPQTEADIDHEVINAGRGPASLNPGGTFFDSVRAFGMIRSGRVDATILGGYEVSERGDLANYKIPGKAFPGIGGGMDLVTGAKTVIIATEHTSKGRPKLRSKCTLPLTGKGVVNWIVTDMAVIEVTDKNFLLREVAPRDDNDLQKAIVEVQSCTDAKLLISPDVKFMEF